MRKLAGLCFMCGLLLASTAHAQEQRKLTVTPDSPERRTALVIGNNAYETAPLKNPVNDARDISKTLTELGFDILYKEDLTQRDMKRAIREFGAKIRNGGVGLFYYAGHGIQVKGVNYLIPVDAQVESEEEVEYEGVEVGFVLAQMESAGNSMNIMILDACRNNPFARNFRSASNGLAQMDAPSGTLIAYATAPGSVASDGGGKNGVYTQELLKFMRVSGLTIEDVLKRVRISVRALSQGKQTPWESSSLTGDFYFSRGEVVSDSAAPWPPAAGTTPPSPSGEAARSPGEGSFEHSTYLNKFFGLRLTLPPSWVVQSKETTEMMSNTGKQLMTKGDKNLESAFDISAKNSFSLLTVSKFPLGSPVASNPMLMCVAERVSQLPGVRRGSDYLFAVRRLHEQTQTQYQFGGTSTETIGGVEFDVMTADLNFGAAKAKQKFYATIRNGFALGFITTYTTDEEGRELERVLRAVKFQ